MRALRELSPVAADPATAGATLASPGARAFLSNSTAYGQVLEEQKLSADQVLQARLEVCLLSSALCMCLSEIDIRLQESDNLPVRTPV